MSLRGWNERQGTTMARFYFHIVTTDDFIPDFDGSELDTLRACYDHAFGIVRACLPHLEDDERRWWIEIADSEGQLAMAVLYPRHYVSERRAVADENPRPGMLVV